MLSLQAISTMVHFYMGTKGPENVSTVLSHIRDLEPCFQVCIIERYWIPLKSLPALILNDFKGLSLVDIFNGYSKRRNSQGVNFIGMALDQSK